MNRSVSLLLLAGVALTANISIAAPSTARLPRKELSQPARKNLLIASPLSHFPRAKHNGPENAGNPPKATRPFKTLKNTNTLGGLGTSANGVSKATPETDKRSNTLEEIERLELENTIVTHY